MSVCQYERRNYSYTCDRESEETTADGFCILHSPNPEKDREAFEEALTAHRKDRGDIFVGFVFPASFTCQFSCFLENADFRDAKFNGHTDFSNARFNRDANFSYAEFGNNSYCKDVDFRDAKFLGDAKFFDSKFSRNAEFANAEFGGNAEFHSAKFGIIVKSSGIANFRGTTVSGTADFRFVEFNGTGEFSGANFSGTADFSRSEFKEKADFGRARFLGRARFVSRKGGGEIFQIFPGTARRAEYDFTDAVIEQPDSITFRDVDLTKCRFLGTDLRKIEFVGVTWPRVGIRKEWPEFILRRWPTSWMRFGIYDEVKADHRDTYPHIEQLYRQLKQNYEDRKDYERASDFHYGEKEMRRRNPKTAWGLRVLLTLYRYVSGYGERSLFPLAWMAVLIGFFAFCYLQWGLLQVRGTTNPVGYTHFWETCLYSLQVMLLLKPINFEPTGLCGGVIYTLQSILGPVLVGLFALAIRQRLKR